MSKLKKIIEEVKDIPNAELDLVDRGISRLDEPNLCKYSKLNRHLVRKLLQTVF